MEAQRLRGRISTYDSAEEVPLSPGRFAHARLGTVNPHKGALVS